MFKITNFKLILTYNYILAIIHSVRCLIHLSLILQVIKSSNIETSTVWTFVSFMFDNTLQNSKFYVNVARNFLWNFPDMKIYDHPFLWFFLLKFTEDCLKFKETEIIYMMLPTDLFHLPYYFYFYSYYLAGFQEEDHRCLCVHYLRYKR